MSREYAFPRIMSDTDVKGLRKKLNMTQKEFSEVLGVSKPTVERWEKDGSQIKGAETILFDLLIERPELLLRKKIQEKQYPLRLNYMYNDKVCATIDVDERNRRVLVNNYTNMVIYRPFGNVEEPTYEMYEEFLESRCFPKTRDKLKIELDKLGLPFYDALLIIEKTQGRMEDDDFWIEIVR